jgi:hypothetical protein
MLCQHRNNFRKLPKHFMNAECVQKVSMYSDCAQKIFLKHADHGVKFAQSALTVTAMILFKQTKLPKEEKF